MPLTLNHDQAKSLVSLAHDQTLLFEYHYAPTYPASESRKPYLHPINSLAGDELTGYRPRDHLWHKGIQMTCAHLTVPGEPLGQNFWGGPTYVRDKGYVQLENVGSQRHEEWDKLETDGTTATLAHRLTWITQAGESWLSERRVVTLPGLNAEDGYYALDWQIALKNVHTKQLLFGSPTTAGRPAAGYGGLFWRGPRAFLGGKVLAGNGLEGPDKIMGQRAPWMAYQGANDGSANHSTLLFIDRPGNPDYPNKWFVRNDPMVLTSFAFSFDHEVPLDPGQTMNLNHRIVFANGTWSRDRIEKYLQDANLHD